MEEKISKIFDEIQEFMLQYVQNTIESLIIHLSYLRGQAMEKSNC